MNERNRRESVFDVLGVILRMPSFRGSSFFSHIASMPEVGTIKCVRWHNRHPKLRKAEAWDSFFKDLKR